MKVGSDAIRRNVRPTIRPSVRPSARPPVRPSVRPSVRLSVRPSVRHRPSVRFRSHLCTVAVCVSVCARVLRLADGCGSDNPQPPPPSRQAAACSRPGFLRALVPSAVSQCARHPQFHAVCAQFHAVCAQLSLSLYIHASGLAAPRPWFALL